MLEHTKAVIFDLDGTLVDSMWVWTAIDEDYIRKYHLNPPEDFHEAMEGMSYTETLVEEFLKARQITHLFDTICTSCEVNKGKPAPDVYLKAAGQLGAEPSACLVFEDVPMGILAGKNAGMRVCAVDDWFSRPQDAKKRELADYFIHSYEDITNQTYEVL